MGIDIIKDKKISIISHSVLAVSVIALMIVAAFYDLQISHAMSNDNSLFGQVFVTLGEFPAYLILPITGTILFYNEWKVNKIPLIFVRIAFSVLVYAGFVIWGVMGSGMSESPNMLGMTLIYSLVFSVAFLGVGSMIKKETCHTLVKWCIFAIAVLALSLLISRLMKMGWGRVRYRDLLAEGSFERFTPWYLPQGISEGNNSFPSGHTSSACNIFVFVALFEHNKKLVKYRPLAIIGAIIFIILTALSRIVINAHYLSDVVMGGSVSYICYYVLKVVFFRNKSFSMDKRSECDNE